LNKKNPIIRRLNTHAGAGIRIAGNGQAQPGSREWIQIRCIVTQFKDTTSAAALAFLRDSRFGAG
jgi:hypothetical protein